MPPFFDENCLFHVKRETVINSARPPARQLRGRALRFVGEEYFNFSLLFKSPERFESNQRVKTEQRRNKARAEQHAHGGYVAETYKFKQIEARKGIYPAAYAEENKLGKADRCRKSHKTIMRKFFYFTAAFARNLFCTERNFCGKK